MTAIAQQLDERLSSLDAATASVVERLVRDALALAETRSSRPTDPGDIAAHCDFLGKIAGALDGERFERPPQDRPEVREEW